MLCVYVAAQQHSMQHSTAQRADGTRSAAMKVKISPYRKDWEYHIIRGTPTFAHVLYACVISIRDRDNNRVVHDVLVFPGIDGRKARAEAVRYGKSMLAGAEFKRLRSTYIPHNFKCPDWAK